MNNDRHFLIIDDSLATIILVRDFLKKLGYQNVHYAQNGNDGIASFINLMNENLNPIVLLDYELGDIDGLAIITKILQLKPDTKVIVQSGRNRTEEPIRQLISSGAYDVMEKPLRLERLKEITETLIDEESPQIGSELISDIEKTISSFSEISLSRICNIHNKTKEEVLPLIEHLLSKNKIIKISDIKEITCPSCNSVRTIQTFHCTKCKGSDFKRDKIIEHYKCGNVSPAISYVNDKCPKCHELIKTFGVDYRVQDNLYMCDECNEVSPDVLINYLCQNCNHRFELEKGRFTSSAGYKRI